MKKILKYLFVALIIVAALMDGYRYLKPESEKVTIVVNERTISKEKARKIIMVYNANGGIFPGLADVLHKEIFPATYPCHLCMLAFGSFGPKEKWTHFLNSLPYKKSAFHKDEFLKKFVPKKMPLPAILIQSNSTTELLVSAKEINSCRNLDELILKIKEHLK